jgi:hypothetical protein
MEEEQPVTDGSDDTTAGDTDAATVPESRRGIQARRRAAHRRRTWRRVTLVIAVVLVVTWFALLPVIGRLPWLLAGVVVVAVLLRAIRLSSPKRQAGSASESEAESEVDAPTEDASVDAAPVESSPEPDLVTLLADYDEPLVDSASLGVEVEPVESKPVLDPVTLAVGLGEPRVLDPVPLAVDTALVESAPTLDPLTLALGIYRAETPDPMRFVVAHEVIELPVSASVASDGPETTPVTAVADSMGEQVSAEQTAS